MLDGVDLASLLVVEEQFLERLRFAPLRTGRTLEKRHSNGLLGHYLDDAMQNSTLRWKQYNDLAENLTGTPVQLIVTRTLNKTLLAQHLNACDFERVVRS